MIDALAESGLPGVGSTARLSPACGSTRRAPTPQDRGHRRAPHAVAARCTASPSTSTPTCAMFGHIVPCGITDKGVTSLRAEGRRRDDARGRRRGRRTGRGTVGADGSVERSDVVWRHAADGSASPRSAAAACRAAPGARRGDVRPVGGALGARRSRLAEAGVTEGVESDRKPTWCGPRLHLGAGVPPLKRTMRDLDAGHGVRGGGLPEHLRVLDRRHGHVHDQRRALHAGVRVLPGRHAQAAAARPGRARAGGRSRRADGPALRGAHRASPATTWPTGAPGRSPRPSTRSVDRTPGHARSRCSSPTARATRTSLGADVRRPSRRAQPQHRDGGAAAAGGAAFGVVRPHPGGAGPGEGGGADDQVGHDRRHRRDRRRGRTRRLADLRGVGVDIVTIGQYLRPTAAHLPVARWVTPDEFDGVRRGRRGAWASATSRRRR